MQAFSNMRRNSTDQNYLTWVWYGAWLVAGQIMSSLYPFIPSFAGVVFCYLIITFERREEHTFSILGSILYLCLFDISKGFYLFSFVILFMLTYRFAIRKIQTMITCNHCILTAYVMIAYIGHYLINAILAFIANEELPYFSNFYFYYIAIDAIIASMIFKVSR